MDAVLAGAAVAAAFERFLDTLGLAAGGGATTSAAGVTSDCSRPAAAAHQTSSLTQHSASVGSVKRSYLKTLHFAAISNPCHVPPASAHIYDSDNLTDILGTL